MRKKKHSTLVFFFNSFLATNCLIRRTRFVFSIFNLKELYRKKKCIILNNKIDYMSQILCGKKKIFV